MNHTALRSSAELKVWALIDSFAIAHRLKPKHFIFPNFRNNQKESKPPPASHIVGILFVKKKIDRTNCAAGQSTMAILDEVQSKIFTENVGANSVCNFGLKR